MYIGSCSEGSGSGNFEFIGFIVTNWSQLTGGDAAVLDEERLHRTNVLVSSVLKLMSVVQVQTLVGGQES